MPWPGRNGGSQVTTVGSTAPRVTPRVNPRSLFHPASGLAYLDGATYGLPPQPTVDALERALGLWQAGEADWIEDWDRPSESCRADFGALIGCSPEAVALISAASIGVGLVAAGLGSTDEVVVPVDEFTSTLFPVLVAKDRGTAVREVEFDRLVESIRSSTTLVAFSLTQMQTGQTADLGAVCRRAREVGARVLVDATQSIPFVPVAPQIREVDYLVCAAYKHLLSPRGVAFLYVRPDHWMEVEPHYANWRAADRPFAHYFGGPLTLATNAARFDVSRAWFPWYGATESLRLIAGWAADGTISDVRTLINRLADGLGVPRPAASLVCAPIADAEAVRGALAAARVKASVRGTAIRFSPHVWSTEEDVDRAIGVVERYRGA